MTKKQIKIKAKVLYDGFEKSNDKVVVIEGDKIVDVTSKKISCPIEGIVTPAIIDPHSHIGMVREGEPHHEEEGNEITSQILPLCNPLHSVYFDDRAFKDAVDFGVLYSCITPGSGNIIAGKAMIIKNFATNRDNALVMDYGYKMALGYNPRSTSEWKGERPITRMGVYALLEKKFDEILSKKEKQRIIYERKTDELIKKKKEKKISKKEYEKEKSFIMKELILSFSLEEKALLEILEGEKTVKVHVHKHDDVYYLIDLVKKYNIKVTAEHAGDVFDKKVFEELAKNDISVVYGPLGTLAYKVELKHAYYQNTKALMRSHVNFGLMSDHPVVHTYSLRESLKYFLIQGMDEVKAINLITQKNAEILNIDDQLGSIQKGKLASLIIWNHDPLHLKAFPKMVIAEGKIIRT